MKSLFTLFILLCINVGAYAQTPIRLEYTAENTVLLNGQSIDNTTELIQLEAKLGQAVLFKEFPNGKSMHHFPEAGLAVHTVHGKLLFLGVNLNWDGDKKYPEQTFVGSLKIGESTIDAGSTTETLSGVAGIEIFCPAPSMCMTKDREIPTPIMASFSEGKITQLGFEFH